jgi:peptidoglycan/LPS O-acetylase OafA/YrhL
MDNRLTTIAGERAKPCLPQSVPHRPLQGSVSPPPYIESHAALRGIAAFTVVMAHIHAWDLFPQWPWLRHLYQIFGWSDLAVFLFFILSGFVMSHVYPNPVHWRHFFVARVARLVPVYEITLLVVCLLAMTSVFHIAIPTADNFIANLLMVQQWLPIPGWSSINGPSWSLSIEAFLYLAAFPLLVWSRKQPWNWILYLLLIWYGVVWATIEYNIYGVDIWRQRALALLSGLYGFGIGFSMQNLIGNGLRHSGIIAAMGTAFILIGMAHQILVPSDMSHGPMVLGLVLIVASSINPQGAPYRLLARPVFLYLGDISYSLYLWHLPILLFLYECRVHVEYHYLTSASSIFGLRIVVVMTALMLIFTISNLSYYRLEAPLRRLIRDRFVRAGSGTAPHAWGRNTALKTSA